MLRSTWILALLAPSIVWAQPTLSSLWPNDDGRRWDYDYTVVQPFSGKDFTISASLRFEGTVETPGGTAQLLVGRSDPWPTGMTMSGVDAARAAAPEGLDPVLRAVWQARPDLRREIESKATSRLAGDGLWGPAFLHYGPFLKNPTNIQMWQPGWNHPTWMYLQDPIAAGATFTYQLVPEFADDVFLHGTIESIDATIETPLGSFEHAVRVRYLIDYGYGPWTDETGHVIGHVHSESRGHVHYVPDVGPVEMVEDFFPFLMVDCSPNECPPEWTEHLGELYQTLKLSLSPPLSIVPSTWGQVKSIYR